METKKIFEKLEETVITLSKMELNGRQAAIVLFLNDDHCLGVIRGTTINLATLFTLSSKKNAALKTAMRIANDYLRQEINEHGEN